MAKKKLKHFIVEVSHEGKIICHEVAAETKILAADLVKNHLAPVPPGMTFRARDTPAEVNEPARYIGLYVEEDSGQ